MNQVWIVSLGFDQIVGFDNSQDAEQFKAAHSPVRLPEWDNREFDINWVPVKTLEEALEEWPRMGRQ